MAHEEPEHIEDTGLELMPGWLAEKIPPLYAQDGKGDDAIVYAKLFSPWGSWTWFITEYDPEERRCFGLVVGHVSELGYFSLAELEEVRVGPGRALTIERDTSFSETTMGKVREALASGGRLGL